MDFGGSRGGSRGESRGGSRGGSAGVKGRGDTPEDLSVKRKVRLAPASTKPQQQVPQGVTKGASMSGIDHHPLTDDLLSHNDSALTVDDAYEGRQTTRPFFWSIHIST